MHGADGDVRELVVTNPRYPAWGRVVVDREGFMEWDYWGNLRDDTRAAQFAAVINAIMATRPGDNGERYVPRAAFRPSTERDRPHP